MNNQPRSIYRPGLVLLILWAVILPLAAQNLQIYFPDVEQGACTVIVSPTGSAMVVDGGTGNHWTDEPLVPFLYGLHASGILSTIDVVVATHYDEDHIGGLDQVINSGLLSAGCIIYDRGSHQYVPDTLAYNQFRSAADRYQHRTITPGTTIDLGGGTGVTCLCVNGDLPDGSHVNIEGADQFENAASVGLRLTFDQFDFFVAGDLTGSTYNGLADVESAVAPFVGDVDLLLLDHHGSRSCSNAYFLSVLKPETAVAQMGCYNNYGHPNRYTVNDLLATPTTSAGTPVLIQTNPGNPLDDRSDDTLATLIADPDDVSINHGRPGTVTLLTDGNTYEAFGRASDTPLKFLSDTAGGDTNLPPAIMEMTTDVPVPESGSPLDVSVHAADEDGLSSLELVYQVDGGSVTPLPLVPINGQTDWYQATIPAQADGALVSFHVHARDTLQTESVSPAQSVFWGITAVSRIRAGEAADGVSHLTGTWVRVQGHLTVGAEDFQRQETRLVLEDDTGGITLYSPQPASRSLLRGTGVSSSGMIDQYNGLTELNLTPDGSSLRAIGAADAVAPEPISPGELDESVEGKLVRLDNLEIVSGTITPWGSSELRVSDDGGQTVVVLSIDGTSDIPGADLPTGKFSVTGVVSQEDYFYPFHEYYRLVPRNRADFSPALTGGTLESARVVINEVMPSPAGLADTNGDGTSDPLADQFVEIVNDSEFYISLGNWSIQTSTGLCHRFAPGTVLPPGQATLVFGGGTAGRELGECNHLGLVFTASTGELGLNPDGDTITLFDRNGAIVDTMTYSATDVLNGRSLNRDPDVNGSSFTAHDNLAASDSAPFSPGTRADGSLFRRFLPILLSEVYYDSPGDDNGNEWVELYNNTPDPFPLDGYSLGSGGADYTYCRTALQGSIPPFSTFVVGEPSFADLQLDLNPGLQNAGQTADGVALFDIPASGISAASVPVDAVIYGEVNDNGLLDENGIATTPDVPDAPSGESLERLSTAPLWSIQPVPTPGTFGSSGWMYIPGDLDFDRRLTITDLVMLRLLQVGNVTTNDYLSYLADIDGNRESDAIDAVLLASVLADNLREGS